MYSIEFIEIRLRQNLLIYLFIIFGYLLQAQEEWDRDAFISEVRNEMQKSSDPEHRREAGQFIRHFNGASFDEGQEEYIYQLIQVLRRKRFNDASDYFEFYRLLNHYGLGHLDNESMDNFLGSSLDYVSKLKHKTAKSYLKYCSDALVDSVLHKGQIFSWKLAEGDIYFVYDSIPKISAEYAKLYCASKVDTFAINMTRGYVDLQGHKWYGNGGRCDWQKHAVPEDSLWVELPSYSIDFRKPYFEVKQAQLLGKLDHDEDVIYGKYYDGLNSNPKRKGAIYPGFIAQSDSLYFYNLFQDVDAIGGMEIIGKRLYMFAKNQRDIELVFYQDDILFVEAKTKRFRVEDNRLLTENAQVKLYWNNDSIVHPQLKLVYTDSIKSLKFERIKQNLGLSPLRSSYHKLDCYFDRMEWVKDSAALYFANDRDPSRNPALLESFNFYNESRYQDLATMDARHPAFIMRTMSRDFKGQRKFLLSEVAKYYSFSFEDADRLMSTFAILGFVDYDTDFQMIYIKDRLYEFLDARLKKRDYDGLRMVSRAEQKPYAKMDLKSGDLAVHGVNLVELSDSNEVAIFPYEGDLVVHRNRNFTFDGIVQTGQFAMFGKQMDFVYDPFEIELNKIDSLQYTVPSGFVDKLGAPINWTVKTVISDIVGKLYIDSPKNKSGLKDKPAYPKLHSYQDSYIYYDKIKNGVYKRDLFSFKADPFQLDSLLKLNTENLEFPGNLNAPTIFPFFRDTMRLDENQELSFSHKIEGRYPAYEGRGAFTNHLHLNGKGLSGEGTIYYLNSITTTDSVYFYPYRAKAHADSHHINEQAAPTDCPVVHVEGASIDWRAFKEEMQSENRELLYTTYRENYDFDGTMTLSPKALVASGELFYDEAISVSEKFILQSRDFTADHSMFHLFAEEGGEKVVFARDLYSAMSFEEDFGSFETLNDSARFELRKNKYHLYFELMEWDRATGKMIFSQFANHDAWLVSVDPYQDSLQFYASDALYNLNTYELDVYGVSEILMSPVTISPDSSHVTILESGKMEMLKNAEIYVDTETVTEYNFYEAEVNIQSGGRFTGSAVFDYIDLEGNRQPIYFSTLEKKGDIVKGVAYIKEEDNFHLDPYFGFKGKVYLDSSKDFLFFEGHTRVHLACDELNRAWIPFADEVDPEDVFIDLNPEVRLTDRQQWHAGVMISHGPTVAYPAFLSSPKRVNDYPALAVDGYVHFDESDWVYIIGSQEKIENRDAPGNIAIYDPEACTLYSEGVFSLGEDAGLLEIEAYGTLFSDFESQSIDGKLNLSFDFLMHRKAAKHIYKKLKRSAFDNQVDESSAIHQQLLEMSLGKRQLKKYNRKKRKGKRFLPSALEHTFYFPQLRMTWNKKSASFLSEQSISLNNIMGRKIDRMISGLVEVRPHSMGDEINIYIELSSDNYYYINYRRGVMSLISSNDEFNKIIAESPRRLSNKKGTSDTGSFRYELGNKKRVQKFLNRVNWFNY